MRLSGQVYKALCGHRNLPGRLPLPTKFLQCFYSLNSLLRYLKPGPTPARVQAIEKSSATTIRVSSSGTWWIRPCEWSLPTVPPDRPLLPSVHTRFYRSLSTLPVHIFRHGTCTPSLHHPPVIFDVICFCSTKPSVFWPSMSSSVILFGTVRDGVTKRVGTGVDDRIPVDDFIGLVYGPQIGGTERRRRGGRRRSTSCHWAQE